MDWAVEPEITAGRDDVRDRIAATVGLNSACLREARQHRGLEPRMVPVGQGWRADDYLRCIDMMPEVADRDLIAVGSMCRRHRDHPEHGALVILDAIDRAFGAGKGPKLHLLGLKGSIAAAVREHPRGFSADSQAFGLPARRQAPRGGFSKTDEFVAGVMADWYRRQQDLLAEPGWTWDPPRHRPTPSPLPPGHPWLAHVAAAREELRDLVAEGEMEVSARHEATAWQWAGMCDEDEEAEAA